MDKGRIIFLNGVTSAGKTSIVEALQERDDIFFYVVANDLFQEMIGDKYLRENYWKYLSEVIIMMYHTAKLYSDMGKNILIDGILVEREEITPHYLRLLEILKNNPLDLVEVYCPLDVCRKRNIVRGDRYENQSDEQHKLMAKNIEYTDSFFAVNPLYSVIIGTFAGKDIRHLSCMRRSILFWVRITNTNEK